MILLNLLPEIAKGEACTSPLSISYYAKDTEYVTRYEKRMMK